ncbi:hypothetical protein ABIB86_008670, partial [Bradyrhizobium sp. JR1.7]|uniref:hypothetical protein n=1 Tax=Bradyrhizobium sp. JR1.7 TaxID=3156368 RepID=UPI00339A457E
PGSPAEWLADGRLTCGIQCLNGSCDRGVDVRLDGSRRISPGRVSACAWSARHAAKDRRKIIHTC